MSRTEFDRADVSEDRTISDLSRGQSAAEANRLPNLDLLRIVAAVMVMVYHLAYTGNASGSSNPVAYPELFSWVNQGWGGVSLFFMISGFVIAISAHHDDPVKFARSRFLRLYPAFFFSMCLTTLVIVFFARSGAPEFQITFMKWLANLIMIPALLGQPFVDGVYWSIVAELMFYGWVTLFIWAGVFNQRQRLFLVGWLLLICLNELWLRSNVLNRFLVTQHGCFFILGIMTYRILIKRIFDWRLDIAIIAAALAFSLHSDMRTIDWMQRHYTPAPAQDHLLSLMRTLTFLTMLVASVRLAPLLSPRLCLIIGGLTYPLYLLHANIGFVLFQQFHGMMDRWLLLGAIMTGMIVLALLVYKYVEPALKSLFARPVDAIMAWLGSRPAFERPVASTRHAVKNPRNPA
jgi:peptidoglycan/LPS O-acetylase OafA/YrhL